MVLHYIQYIYQAKKRQHTATNYSARWCKDVYKWEREIDFTAEVNPATVIFEAL